MGKPSGWLIYSGYYWSEATQFVLDSFNHEFEKRGCPLKLFKSNELVLYCNKNGSIKCADGHQKPEFVLFWDKDITLAKMLEKWGAKLYNSANAIEICDSKILTHIALANHDVAMPETVFGPLVFNTCEEKDDIFVSKLLNEIPFPMVVKESAGSFGAQVYLVRNEKELKERRKQLVHIPHLYQRFVKPSEGKDARIIVLNGKAIASMVRKNGKDFRSNIELGGKALAEKLPDSFFPFAENVAKILKLDFCGVDLLFENNQSLLCEVNSNPYFRGISACTGVNVAGLYAEYIISNCK